MKLIKNRDGKVVHLLLLLAWIILGIILRFTNLDLKPASSIEIATIGYSLGHGFSAIPLDQLLSIETLLEPLHLDTTIGYSDVFDRLVTESTHPPLYFWLTHWWISLWTANGDLTSLQVARSLSAIFGVLTIPAIFSLGWISFPSPLVAHLAAVLMAISPYGVHLAQESRHYTLSIFWVIISLSFLIKSLRLIQQKKHMPIWFGCVWISVNALGIATHYFFAIALGAQAISLIIFSIVLRRKLIFKYWCGIYLVVLGTMASCLVWLPLVTKISDNEITSWIETSFSLHNIFVPFLILMGWLMSMVMLLPLEGVSTPIVVVSASIWLTVAIWAIPKLIKAWRFQITSSSDITGILILSSYLLGSILLFVVVIYGLQRDLSLAARYHFIYFPVFILLIALALASCWQNSQLRSKQIVVVILTMGLLGSLTVVNDYGFKKSRDSDRLAAFIQNNSTNHAIVAMRYNTHSEIRELIGIAYSFNLVQARNKFNSQLVQFTPQFLLNQLYIDGNDMGLYNIDRALDLQPRPLDFWAINLAIGEEDMNRIQCFKSETLELELVESGYRDRLYRCEQRQ